MIPTLKGPGTKRLKLEYDDVHSNFAFKFKLRRYSLVKEQQEVIGTSTVPPGT
jgi:hypothetical protein